MPASSAALRLRAAVGQNDGRPWIRACLRFALLALTSAWFPLSQAGAQISPGPLSRAHQSLDGATQCTSCHKLGGGAAVFKCLDCHTEIAERAAARRGLHATFHIPAGSSQECARCHSEHNGRDFPLIKFDPGTFDHKQAGYALEGRHAALACSRCHSPEHIGVEQRANIKVRDLKRTFLGLSAACTTCHQDAHQGRLGQNCAQCHNTTDWKAVMEQFDHSRTRFPLTGLHARVKCQQCHAAGADGKPRYAGLSFSKCADCHSDPHRAAFGQQTCESCHSTSGWAKISLPALNRTFDHAKTRYPLLGKHQEAACSSCHRNADFKQPLAFGTCMSCHQDQHQGQFVRRAGGGECAACHTVEGFKRATFGLKEHAATAYPLLGKHAAVPCAQCHIPRGRETRYRIPFDRCLQCHKDEHAAQFAAAPYQNRCEQCHSMDGFKPSQFGLAQHKQARFLLTGGHLAVPCQECHQAQAETSAQAKPVVRYHFPSLACTTCHQDPHRGQFQTRMQRVIDGREAGCEACHSTKAWTDLTQFDHAQTEFALVGAHRAVACIDCHKPPNLGVTLRNVDFRSAPTQCEDCHSDVHVAQFAKTAGMTPCAGCHNSGRWRPSLFDHETRTVFPLRGAHLEVRCAECHKLTRLIDGKAVLFYKPTPKQCAECHGANVPTSRTN